MQIVECDQCGLVTLSVIDHIVPGFYENSGMHGVDPSPIEEWLKETKWDDKRRFDMVKAMLPNKRLLDFGCGAAGFLQLAKNLAEGVMGIELETRVRDHWVGKLRSRPVLKLQAGGGI